MRDRQVCKWNRECSVPSLLTNTNVDFVGETFVALAEARSHLIDNHMLIEKSLEVV